MTRSRPSLAVIAGTGVAESFGTRGPRWVKTKYGSTFVSLDVRGRFYVVPRHGKEGVIPPHRINHRANISALFSLGVRRVMAVSAVGSADPGLGVGEIGLLGQFIDLSGGREATFFDDEIRHTDMTRPYSEALNAALKEAAEDLGLRLHSGLVYVCTRGPRFETAAEVTMIRGLGGDVVGMTGVPEVVLARELGLEYASVVVVTNLAAGLQERVSHEEVEAAMREAGGKASALVEKAAKLL